MYLHIVFTDGSNPWVSFGDEAKLSKELRKWRRNYIVEKLYGTTYKATNRAEDTDFIASLSNEEQKTIRRHIIYKLKRNGAYTKENVEEAMSARVCDVY